jgi:hypothetical protein
MQRMIDRTVEPGTEAGWAVIDAAVACARGLLGQSLLSAYAIGSLAHGGFRPAASDVDLALLTDDRRDLDIAGVVHAIADQVAAAHPLGSRLSIFHVPWSAFPDPPADARFPPIDRYDLVRYGILVHGSDLRSSYAKAPSAEEIRAQAVDHALSQLTVAKLDRDLHELRQRDVTVRDATKVVLWPVRLHYVCDTGTATGNADAVQHYLRLPGARHRSLVADALGWRDLPALASPAVAVRRITTEVHDLHAEVFQRLADDPDAPRRNELVRRGEQLADARPPAGGDELLPS